MPFSARAPRPRVALSLSGLLLLGCATGGDTAPVPELHPSSPPNPAGCNVVGEPGPVESLVDPGAIRASIADLGLPDGGVVISFATDSAGGLSRFRLAETTLPEAGTAEVVATVESLVPKPVPGPRRGGRLLIRLAGGEVVELTVGPYRACRPTVVNTDEVQQALTEAYRRIGREAKATVRVHVDTTGVPTEVRLHEPTGQVETDLQLLSAAQKLRFTPATIDAEPVAVWVQLDLSVEQWCPPPRDSTAWARLEPFDACWKRPHAPLRWRP